MEENTQLPKEVVEEINEQADKYGFVVPYNDSNKFYNDDKLEGYKAGATAYAIKLHQANETIKELERQNEKMKRQAAGWRPLLEDILREDDNNIAYISVDLINKIKTFLYGE